jgi:hypothetical protein
MLEIYIFNLDDRICAKIPPKELPSGQFFRRDGKSRKFRDPEWKMRILY